MMHARPALSRRQILGAAAALGVAAMVGGRPMGGYTRAGHPLADLAASIDLPRISVGFLDGIADRAGGAVGEAGARVVPATSVTSQSGSGSVALRISGATPAAAAADWASAVHLDALVDHPDGGDPLRVFAWTQRGGSAPMTSPPSRLVLPVDPFGLGFALSTTDPDGVARDLTSVMTPVDGDGMPGLRRGTYLLGLGDGTWDSPTRLPAADDSAWADLASLVVTLSPQ